MDFNKQVNDKTLNMYSYLYTRKDGTRLFVNRGHDRVDIDDDGNGKIHDFYGMIMTMTAMGRKAMMSFLSS